VKHPSEWRYTDPAFWEVAVSGMARAPGTDLSGVPVFEGDNTHPMHSMGYFQRTYFPHLPRIVCWIDWPNRRAEICYGAGTGHWVHHLRGEIIAQLRRIESQEQLVRWCKMVGEMVDET
jgi:hypothetical protein